MKNSDFPIEAAAEILFDENGDCLWVKQYIFSRLHAVGETFIDEYIEYEVLASSVTIGKHRGALVEHVVRKLGDTRQKGMRRNVKTK